MHRKTGFNVNGKPDTAIVQQITINQQVSPSKGNLENLRRRTEDIYGLASDLRGPGSRIWFGTEAGQYKLHDNIAIWPGGSGRDRFTILILHTLNLFTQMRIPSWISYFLWVRLDQYQYASKENRSRLITGAEKNFLRFPAR